MVGLCGGPRDCRPAVKVGFHIGAPSPAAGGAYTYVTEVLAALSRAGRDCRHELVLCHDSFGEDIARAFPEFASLDLTRENLELASRRERALEALSFTQRAGRFVGRLAMTPAPPVELSWEDLYARDHIHFVVSLVPGGLTSTTIPFATTVWDLQHRNSPWFPEVSLRDEWDHRESDYASLRKATYIYTGTQQGRREIASYYQIPAERINVLPFATPTFALRAGDQPGSPDHLDRFSLPADYVFYPAQFWPHKNHVVILEACKIVRDTTGWDLNIVFSGADKGNFQYVRDYAARLGLGQQTRFLGFVEQAELVELYRGAFGLTFPTLFGPDNLPPLEAFAIGCPVLASDIPGAREQLGNAAIFFSPVDEKALAEAILSLRNAETREQLVNAGRARAASHTWDEYAKGIISSLDDFSAIRRAWP